MLTLTCDMVKGCTKPVTHIGNKGYVYCSEHARIRRQSGFEHTRTMLKREIQLLQGDKPLAKY